MKRSGEVLSKTKTARDKISETYTQMVTQERTYFSLLRELQMEYQKNEKLLEVLGIQQNE
jgi:hypothetical protein